jgi:hypothetical protein
MVSAACSLCPARVSGGFRRSAPLLVLLLLLMNTDVSALEAVILEESAHGSAEALSRELGGRIEDAGYAVNYAGCGDLCDAAKLASADLLVLPDASALPFQAVPVIHDFLKAGGDIIAFNAPLGRELLMAEGGGWLNRPQWRMRYGAEMLTHTLIPFTPEDIAGWHRGAADMDIPATYKTVEAPESPSGRALHVWVSNHNGWDTFHSTPMEKPFPEGHTLTVFFAKGGPKTPELSVEWREKDGSRWIATIPLSTNWEPFVLQPSDFRFWESTESRRGTQFNPDNAMELAIGLSNTHTNAGGGEHEYFVGAFGTAPRTALHEKMLTRFEMPALDTLTRNYKFFPCRDVAGIKVRSGQCILQPGNIPMPDAVYASHPRPRGAGFDKDRAWRWTPLLEAATADKEWRGNPATLLVHADGDYKGGAWASFAVRDRAWYANPEVLDMAGRIAAKMADGVFILDGGTDFYTYFDEQPMRLGMRVANLSEKERTLHGEANLTPRDKTSPVFTSSWRFQVMPGEVAVLEDPVAVKERGGDGPWTVEARLSAEEGGVLLDTVSHEAHIWKPSPDPSYVTVEDGEFMLDGKRWRVHGVNYMPSSGIGIEDQPYFEFWIGARAYDPEVIQRDLDHIADMGMNAVSIFIYRESMEAQNLLDLLRRLQVMGLKADLSLRPGTPLDFRWEEMRELLAYYRIAEHDCIFGLDLAWEPMFGNHDARRRWDPAWREWITERYGSIENAAADWEYEAPRDEQGRVSNPLNHWTVDDGPWRVFVAAYRRFLDTLLYEYYSRARTLVRSVNPNHLVSYRMTEAGNPTFRWGERIPHQWPYLAGAVDILEPEAYGRIGGWEKVKPGWFQHAWARCCAPHLPMMWKEAGVNEWATHMTYPSPEESTFKQEYYRNLYRMFTGSRCAGIFFWWYPGGYRVNENSDYGIINPDGSDRAVTRVIREHAQALLEGPSPAEPDHWFEVDRDKHPDGIAGIYDDIREDFWKAVAAGKTPGLRTPASGTTTADCPMIAVGNRPYTGKNPPKYIDGFFDAVEVGHPEKGWLPVEDNGAIELPESAPVRVRLTCTNLGEAAWRSPRNHDGKGSVWIVCEDDSSAQPACMIPEDVPRFGTLEHLELTLPEGSSQYTLRFSVKDRCRFGPAFRFSVK